MCVVAVLLTATSARADARTDYLVRVLRTSSMFRVRVQAAISLGSVQTEPQVVDALMSAVGDDHPAVRAAAAAALERHGDPRALAALRRRANDPEPAVRSAVARAIQHLEQLERSQPRRRAVPDSSGTQPPPSGPERYYVAVGRPGSRSASLSRDILDGLRTFLEGQVRGIEGVVLAPERESPAAASRVLRQRNLAGFYLDSSIVEITPRPEGGMRVRVSVVVQTYPGRDIRSMLSGQATVTAGSGPAVQRQAIEAALRGALRQLPNALSAGVARAGP